MVPHHIEAEAEICFADFRPESPHPEIVLYPKLCTRDEALNVEGGGIYIAIDTARGNRPLKVGVASSFKVRLGHATYLDMERRRPRLRFYLARIQRGRIGPHGIGGADKAIERSIARTLYRAGEKLLSTCCRTGWSMCWVG